MSGTCLCAQGPHTPPPTPRHAEGVEPRSCLDQQGGHLGHQGETEEGLSLENFWMLSAAQVSWVVRSWYDRCGHLPSPGLFEYLLYEAQRSLGQRTVAMNPHANTFHFSLFLILPAHGKSRIKSQGPTFYHLPPPRTVGEARGPSSVPMSGRHKGERGLKEQVRARPLSKEISTLLSLSETVFSQVGPAVTRATENPGLCFCVCLGPGEK